MFDDWSPFDVFVVVVAFTILGAVFAVSIRRTPDDRIGVASEAQRWWRRPPG